MDTMILILGTFNPDTSDITDDFFYGSSRNFLWRILPTSFGYKDLKSSIPKEKINFIEHYKIDFVDLIKMVEVEKGQEANRKDNFIDSKVKLWTDVIGLIQSHESIKKIGFTRKTFIGIPNITQKIMEIREYCDKNSIDFQCLSSPARYYSSQKQMEWNTFLNI